MGDIFSAAGLPEELLEDLETIALEQLELRISTDTRRYGKMMTIISGLDGSVDPKRLLSTLKAKCACGGAFKDGHIELQGDHVRRVQLVLRDLGIGSRAD